MWRLICLLHKGVVSWLFAVRNRSFSVPVKGTRQGPEGEKNQWKQSLGITHPNTSAESDWF